MKLIFMPILISIIFFEPLTIVAAISAQHNENRRNADIYTNGNLRNGKRIEYRTGEIVIGFRGKPVSEEYLRNSIKVLEENHGVSFMSKNRLGNGYAMFFEIMDDQDTLETMYAIQKEGYEFTSFITVNGIGTRKISVPQNDFHVIKLSKSEKAKYKAGTMSQRKYMMEKYPFLKWGSLLKGKMEVPYKEGEFSIYVSGTDRKNIVYDDILALTNDENGILIGYFENELGQSYWIYFPHIHSQEDHMAQLSRLMRLDMFKEKKEEMTGASYSSWSNY